MFFEIKKQKIFFRFFLIFVFLITSIYLSGCSCGCSKNSKSYYIGIDPSFYPLGLGLLEKNVYGYTQEILLEMAEEMNVRFFLIRANWDNLFDGLDANTYRAVFSSKYPFSFEKDKYNFSKVYLETGPSLITRKDSRYTSLKDFDDKLIGYISSDDSIFILEKYPDIIVKNYDSIPELLDNVQNGYLEGATIDYLIGLNYVNNIYSCKLKINKPLTQEGLRLVSFKENEEIIKIFNEGLEKLQKKGILNRLQRKWGL